jgi:hypothetical protein
MTWVFFAEIRDEFTLGLDALRDHSMSLNLGHNVLQLGEEEVAVRHREAYPCSFSYATGNIEAVAGLYGKVVTMQLKGSLEVVDSLVGSGSKAIHLSAVCRTRMPGQPPRNLPARKA